MPHHDLIWTKATAVAGLIVVHHHIGQVIVVFGLLYHCFGNVYKSFNESFLVSSEVGLAIPEGCYVASPSPAFEIERGFGTITGLGSRRKWQLLRSLLIVL